MPKPMGSMSFRTDEETIEALRGEAVQRAVSVSEVINEKVSRNIPPLSAIASTLISGLAENFALSLTAVCDCVLVDWCARRAAEEEILGKPIFATNPFAYNLEGQVLRGDDLYLALRDLYRGELLANDHIARKAFEFQRKRHEALKASGGKTDGTETEGNE